MKLTTGSSGLAALGLLMWLFGPTLAQSSAYTLFSPPLDVEDRDYRFFGDFADPSANNNNTPHANFPGVKGALMSLWKGAAEWGSGPHGTGTGDPQQPTIGDGGANFDFYWAGFADERGGGGDQVVSVIPMCGGGVLAYVDTPTNGGWRMTVCETWTWHDGPGGLPQTFFDVDLQAVMTHEFGHTFGLGHSTVAGSTMSPLYFGTGARSIEPDDIAGIQAIYGVKDVSKPEITGVALVGNTLTVDGFNFDGTDNELWFTNIGPTAAASHPHLKLTGVPAVLGGTQIQVALPNAATSGAVLVRAPGMAYSALSNSFPLDLGADGFLVELISPTTIPALIPGTAPSVRIEGSNLSSSATIDVGGVAVPQSAIMLLNSRTLLFGMPQVMQLGPTTVTITQGSRSTSLDIEIVAPTLPTLQCGTGDDGNAIPIAQGVDLLIGGFPGELHVVAWSTDPAPSLQPGYLTLSLGNGFTRVFMAGPDALFTIPPTGWLPYNQPIPGAPSGLTVYAQSIRLTGGSPFAVSLRQIFMLQ